MVISNKSIAARKEPSYIWGYPDFANQKEVDVFRPLLIIGVGGSGGKTIRAMIASMEKNLISAGYEGGIPAAWQFLHIDVTYDGITFPAPMLERERFYSVAPPGMIFDEITEKIEKSGNLSERQEMFSGWGTPRSAVTIAQSPYPRRASGRQVGIADAANIVKAIQTSIAKMSSPKAEIDLMNAAKALGVITGVSLTPQAFIISSVAGGTGAGMFIDVAELLKCSTTHNWASSAISFLYTAEVFNSLGNSGGHIAKNSLGVMNEIMASRLVGVSKRTELLYSKMGLVNTQRHANNSFGPMHNFLIGCKNDSVDISSGADGWPMDEVFFTTGESLAGVLTTGEISEFLFVYAVPAIANKWAIDMSGISPRNRSQGPTAVAGIGFSQLTTGADLIVDYVADALTKKQVEKLLWPELSPIFLEKSITVNFLIQDRSDEIWPSFLIESGFGKQGENSHITSALFPDGWKEEVATFAKKIIEDSVLGETKPLGRFADEAWSQWEIESEVFLQPIRDQINAKARAWVPAIQDHLRDNIALELSQNGYAVTSELVGRLQAEITDVTLPGLLRDHGVDTLEIKNFDQIAFDRGVEDYAEGLTDITLQNGVFLEKLIRVFKSVLEVKVNLFVNNLGTLQIQDMSKSLLVPLINQLIEARFELTQHALGNFRDGRQRKNVSSFPDWGSKVVYGRYKPRALHRTLIDISEYELTYERYSASDSGIDSSFNLSVDAALLGKKLKSLQNDSGLEQIIAQEIAWQPDVSIGQDKKNVSPTQLKWRFEINLETLEERNRQWLRDPASAFGHFTTMSIRDFVNEEGLPLPEHTKRENCFINEFKNFISLAQPLVKLNSNVMKYVVAAADGQPANKVLPKSSKIPFAAGSAVGVACTQILDGLGVPINDGAFDTNWFDAASIRTTMYATATTQASLPAWAFASLTDPILEQAAVSKLAMKTWQQFWDGRRARPLVEAIPFEAEMRRSIITGWFLASYFGLRDISVHATGKAVKLWNPTLSTPGWSTFPSPLLATHPEDARRGNWLLPSLFTSAGIALCEFGKTGNLEYLHPYLLLKYLGREVTTKLPNRDEWDHSGGGDLLPTELLGMSTFIEDWLRTGNKPAPEREFRELFEAQLAKGVDRATALLAFVQEIREQYASAWKDLENVEWHALPHTWELKEDIDLALADIYNYVNNFKLKAPTGV